MNNNFPSLFEDGRDSARTGLRRGKWTSIEELEVLSIERNTYIGRAIGWPHEVLEIDDPELAATGDQTRYFFASLGYRFDDRDEVILTIPTNSGGVNHIFQYEVGEKVEVLSTRHEEVHEWWIPRKIFDSNSRKLIQRIGK